MRSQDGNARWRVTAPGVGALLGCGLLLAGTARADDEPIANSSLHVGRSFGRIAWSEHALDWRQRFLDDELAAPSALGWVATRLDVRGRTLSSGWSFDIDSGQNRFAVHYRILY
jgi:hypothetical protein